MNHSVYCQRIFSFETPGEQTTKGTKKSIQKYSLSCIQAHAYV